MTLKIAVLKWTQLIKDCFLRWPFWRMHNQKKKANIIDRCHAYAVSDFEWNFEMYFQRTTKIYYIRWQWKISDNVKEIMK